MTIKAIIFDLDGTLIDSKEGITKCIRETLSRLNQPVPSSDELEWCIGPSLYDIFTKLLGCQEQELLQKAVEIYRIHYRETGILENSVYPQVKDVLKELSRRKIRLFVATTKTSATAQKVLANHSLQHFFDGIYGNELNGGRSDKKELISLVLHNQGLDHRGTLMVGDRSYDIIGAKRNGLLAIGVCYGYGTEKELRESGADYLFATPSGIIEFIKQNDEGFHDVDIA